MADTAAFFAKKKTKKKKFKTFNANKIDASKLSTDTHVDARPVSENVTTALGGLSVNNNQTTATGILPTATAAETTGNGDDQWADTTQTWGNKTSATTSGDSKVAELLDMQALEAKRNEQDDVAERLRIEETKAQLARAKEGMAKEGERLAAEKAGKEFKKVARSAAPSSRLGGGGGKWVPSHMRSGGIGSSVRGPASMDGSSLPKSVDMANEELFPDLADADKILKEKETKDKEEQDRNMASVQMSSGQTRAPAGWGSKIVPGGGVTPQRKPLNLKPAERKPLNLKPVKKESDNNIVDEPKAQIKTETIKEEPKAEPEKAPVEPAPTPVESKPAPSTAATAKKPTEKRVLKKKKKKDLSTFKAKKKGDF